MKQDNIVSIWLGNFKNKNELEKYTMETYTDEGDYIVSQFCEDFFAGKMPYEYDFFEQFLVKEKSNDLIFLIKGSSYDNSITNSIIKSFNSKLENYYNTVILIYDFKYQFQNKNISKNLKNKIDFITSVSYSKK